MKKALLLLLLSSVCNTPSPAQINAQKLDSLFSSLESRDLALGSLTISRNGSIQYQNSIGSFLVGDQEILPQFTAQYRIGSVTKMFTAVMIFQLIGKRTLTLEQKLSAYFPELPAAEKITISNLLNHRSGLHDYTKDTDFESWMDQPRTHEELLKIIQDKPLDFEPDTNVDYSNTNYLLLGYILEKIYKLPYAEILKQKIVSPAGLKNTYFGKETDSQDTERLSYKWSNGTWQPVKQTHMSIHGGAGSVISTPGDLVTFIYALFNKKLIRNSSLEKMKTFVDDYGMGMFGFDHGSHKGYGHNGRIEEFYTAVRYFPESKIAVAYCTNGINFPRIDILEAIIKSCFNEKFVVPFASSAPPDLTLYQGAYEAQGMPVVTISFQATKLVAETQGAKFELEPVMENYFMHTPTGYYFEFVPAQNELQIKETDNVYFLKKK